jgi:neutral ceramidase
MKILASFALALLLLAATAPAAEQLRAGAATSNITPELGSKIVGGFSPFPATGVHDELHARCLVLDDGKTKLALVVCDLIGLHRSVSGEARRLIEEATGIPPANIAISCTHTHSAASALGDDRYTSAAPLDAYQSFVARRISDGVRRAVNALRPAQIAFGSVEAPEHVFNRRWFMREGTARVNPFGKVDKVMMNPQPGSANLVEPAGPTDPTISFIALREPGGRMISLYSAYSLHYVGGVGGIGGGDISADYYGMFCEALAKLQSAADSDPPFVAMMANGTSGDVNNVNFRNPRPPAPPYTQMHKVAEDVASKVNAALAKVDWKESAELDARFRDLELAWRAIDPELLAWAKEKQAHFTPAAGKTDLPWIYAGRVLRLAEAKNPARIPLQVMRIGDVCIGTFPCETFAEIGLEYKKRSPFAHSFMVELNHGYFGYLPTPRHFELGGYETWPGTNSLEPQASVKMMDALLEMTAEVAPKAK